MDSSKQPETCPTPNFLARGRIGQGEKWMARLCSGLTVYLAGQILFSALAAFFHRNFLFSDYGVYTNFIWNLGHGNGFKFLMEDSYLQTHLSFTLALLGPLYHVWDSPLLLIFVQWGVVMAGGGFLVATLRRLALSPVLVQAILLWFVGYPFTQNVLLSEFHGVAFYFLFFPWLTYCLLFAPKFAWIPFLLTLGLREDAGFYLPLMCLVLGRRAQNKTAYWMAGLSLAYALLAVFVLYPAINGTNIWDLRSPELTPAWDPQAVFLRLRGTFWVMLPLAGLLVWSPKLWKPLLLFAFLPWLITILSGDSSQYAFRFHYPAALMAALGSGLATGFAQLRGQPNRRFLPWVCVWLVLCVGGAHARWSFLPGGGDPQRVYRTLNPGGRTLLALTRDLPKEGMLIADQRLAVFAANREDIMIWRYWKPETQGPRWVLCYEDDLRRPNLAPFLDGLRAGEWGVNRSAFPFLVLEKSGDLSGVPDVLAGVDALRIVGVFMHSHRRVDRALPGHGLLRHWRGERGAYPQTVAFGVSRRLEAGVWRVDFTLRAEEPIWEDREETGWLSLHVSGRDEALVREEIRLTPGETGEAPSEFFSTQALTIHLETAREIEPRLTGASSEVWLRHIDFIRVE
ncbi:MAG: DUF2079 domain-containing protein [Verrucomicrobia bacterium]|nr:DUF2079 domain-containing protein [Verrucomicrobiota bacterium]MCH8514059.1 DUF2079 domain-containing protein [Kiritimatiellia bacterium]